MYNIDEDDDQLIDLTIDIGDPHPKIVQGKEVIPARMTSDTPLITVDVRQHIGRLENAPYSIKQTQQVRFHSMKMISKQIVNLCRKACDVW